MRLVKTREGATDLLVPRESLGTVPPTLPVFYNPSASPSRDVSVAVTSATSGEAYCDVLAGIGSRGVRIANEVQRDITVTLVDFNKEAIALGRRNARLNGRLDQCEFALRDANSYLYSRQGRDQRFDYVDVDPFGTPVPYFQAALRATKDGGVVTFTATDTAVLCGVHGMVARMRYGGTPLNNHFHHETGLRLLLNAIRREGASLDIAVRPLLVHSTRHYMRAYVRVEVGPSRAAATLSKEGFVTWCQKCGHTAADSDRQVLCAKCGARVKPAGPLWVGRLTDSLVVGESLAAAERSGLTRAQEVLAALQGIDDFPPWSFSIEGICSELGIATVPQEAVLNILGRQGFRTGRQPFEKTGLKTDAGYDDVRKAVRDAGPSLSKLSQRPRRAPRISA